MLLKCLLHFRGQPWIVNNLFKRATMRIRQQMILARETHLDALAERLKEPEIRSVNHHRRNETQSGYKRCFQTLFGFRVRTLEREAQSDYYEAFPHLLLMAFLQRILNGGDHFERECAAGRRRMDCPEAKQNPWDKRITWELDGDITVLGC